MTHLHGYIAILLFGTLGMIFKWLNWNLQFKLRLRYDYFHRWAVILCGFFLIFLVYASMLAGDRYTKGAAYSDLPFHLNIISSFAYGPNYVREGFFKADSTFYHGANLAYPLMPDFLAAALITTGDASMQQSLFIPSGLMMYSVILSIYTIARHYTNDSTIGILSILIFMCLGGLCFIMFADPTWELGEKDYVDMIHNWPGDIEAFWFHPIMHYLIPQRSALFGVPLCYWSIHLLMLGVKSENFKFFFFAALLTGLTPQVQAHAYMSMAQWSIAFCITMFPFKTPRKYIKYFLQWAVYGIFANVFALPQLPPFFQRVKSRRSVFLSFDPIYKMHGFFKTWWWSLGAFAFCALIGGFAEATKEQIILYIPSLVVFAISNLIKYQEWEWDNIKVFYNGWIPIAVPFAAQYIYSFQRRVLHGIRPTLNNFIYYGLMCLALTSGICCHILYLGTPTEIFTEQQLKFGRWVAENTGPYDYFIGDQSTDQPVCTLGGRPVVVGYPGWIESHGLDLNVKQNLVYDLMHHPEKAEKFDKEGIKYVYMSGTSEIDFDPDPDSNVWQIVYEDINITLYKRI